MMPTEIATQDGPCRAWVFRPEGTGPWPGVLFYMDGIGIRPALFEMGERIAKHGYFVLLPDMFFRAGPYEAPDPKKLFGDPNVRQAWFEKIRPHMNPANAMVDTRAFLDFLAAQADVRQPRFGTTGYCMGGGMSLTAAGTFPDRIAAAAAFHPAGLATDQPTSPHLLAPKIKARVYVAGASEDQNFPDEQKARLDAALTDAGVAHTVETYPARHGWVPSDTPVHDPAQAERAWTSLFELFDKTLRD
ncbi:MAG TPA: dienelactone hydrolase family protein [Kofleriaceae bacterium]|nr:dienelactone hydrolase family protein [Kofleriaceae bacterium]